MKERAIQFARSHSGKMRAFYFPALICWLELTTHLFDRGAFKYMPIYILFAVSLGFFLSALTEFPAPRAAGRLSCFLSGFSSFAYMAEFVAKKLLQTYYPLSSLETAANNKLHEFIGIIVETVFKALPVLIVMSLPFIYLLVVRKYIYVEQTEAGSHAKAFKQERGYLALLCLAAFALAHLLGLAAVHMPYTGDLTPAKLYRMDTSYNDQFEQLGLYNMIRLDVKHSLFGTEGEQFDPSAIAEDPETPEDPEVPDEPEPEPPVVYGKNVMDVDFAALSEKAPNSNMRWLCDYFGSLEPSSKNQYTGMYEGYNVIFVTVESLSSYAVSEKYTPTLYRMMNEGFVFDNFYTALHFTSTSNGECQHLLGLYPKNGQPITMSRTGQLKTNCYFSLAAQLGRLGYKNYGYHNNWDLYERNSSHSNLGYDWKWCGAGVPYEKNGSGDLKWPQRDSYMIEQTAHEFIDQDEPFNVYYLTVSGHTPYSWNWVCSAYREQLEDAPYSEPTKAYIATVMECDKALEELIAMLEEAGKLDKTVFVVSGDHVPYTGVEILEELADRKFGSSEAVRAINESDIDFELYHNGLAIWNSQFTEPVHIDKVCCQVDILPTLSNLLGLEYDSRMLSGTDILSDSEGMVVFSSRCFMTDMGFYNRFDGEFTLAPGKQFNDDDLDEYVDRMKALAGYKLDCTARIVENNFYDYVFGNKYVRPR